MTAALIAAWFQRKLRWQLAAYFERPKSSPLAVSPALCRSLSYDKTRLLRQKGAAAQHRKLRGSGGGGVVRSLVFRTVVEFGEPPSFLKA